MMSAFEATVEILKVRLANLDSFPNEAEAEQTAEYAEKLFVKLKQLRDEEKSKRNFNY